MTREASPKLVAVGDNCLDAFLTKDLITVGGNALNVAVQWRRNGWAARYFGAVGDDPEGEVVLAEVAAAGLAPGDVEIRRGETAVTLVQDRSGDRTFLLEAFGVGEDYMPLPEAYAAITAADWVHLGTNANPDLVRQLVRDRVPFSVDVSTAHFKLPLDGVPLVFASGPDEAGAPVEQLLAQLRTTGAVKAVVTCGSHGAYVGDGAGCHHAPATPVDVVDTCGAGDSFIATFLTATCCEGLGTDEALRKATVAASWTCTHFGGFPQQPRSIPLWLPVKYADVIKKGKTG